MTTDPFGSFASSAGLKAPSRFPQVGEPRLLQKDVIKTSQCTQDYLKQVGRKDRGEFRSSISSSGETLQDFKVTEKTSIVLGVIVQEYWRWHPFQVHGDEPGCFKHLGETEFFRKHRSGVHRPSGTASSEGAPKIQWWRRWTITSTSSTCEWMTSSLRLGFRFKISWEGDMVDNAWSSSECHSL